MMFIVKYIVCLIGTMLMYAVLSLFGEVDFIEELTPLIRGFYFCLDIGYMYML